MNTVQQTVLAQAKQGNPDAIAVLMRKQLEEKGIQVRVSRKGDLLIVDLASAQAPPKASSLNFVKNGLANLGVNNIRAVQVRGYKLGKAEPEWIDHIVLATPSATRQLQQPVQEHNHAPIEPKAETKPKKTAEKSEEEVKLGIQEWLTLAVMFFLLVAMFNSCLNSGKPSAAKCRKATARLEQAKAGEGPWKARHYNTLINEQREACR